MRDPCVLNMAYLPAVRREPLTMYKINSESNISPGFTLSSALNPVIESIITVLSVYNNMQYYYNNIM